MIHRPVQIATSVLLSAFLVAAGIAPPGVRHVHPLPGGVAEHDHDHAPGHCHSGTADHPHEGHREHQHTPAAVELGDLWHLHFAMLGIELTLPDTTPVEENRNGESDFELILLRPSEDPLLTLVTCHESTAKLAASAAMLQAVDATPCQTVTALPSPVQSAPLCDSARHERSGVLLA